MFSNIIISQLILAVMTTQNWLTFAGLVLTVFAIIFAGGRLFERIGNIKNEIDDLKPDVKMIPLIKERVDVLWASRYTQPGSPMVLTEAGKKILLDSKIENFTTEYYNEILNRVKGENLLNAYQAQEALIDIVRSFKNDDACKNKLENAAFTAGVDVDTVLLVGAVNIRNKIIGDLNMNVEDIDKFDPHKTQTT